VSRRGLGSKAGRGSGGAGAWPSPDVLAGLRRSLGGRSSPVGLVLGSGLGGIAQALEDPWRREAREIPGYPESTVAGHQGRLLLGALGGAPVWVVQGRVHLYEGYAPEQVTRYVRLIRALGVEILVLTNAAGSVDPRVRPGDIVLAEDAVNLFFRPLAGIRRPPFHAIPGTAVAASPRPPAAAQPARVPPAGPPPARISPAGIPAAGDPQARLWRRRGPVSDPGLVRLAVEAGRAAGIAFERGTLVGSSGPSYETAAEVRVWRRLGGTVASMSTVPEALEARELGARCLLFSLVTNYATGLSSGALSHGDVVDQAGSAGARLGRLLRVLVPRLVAAVRT
jgi:purine-nucleoside phosphorylase